ncbi:MAG TPA: hypothetical protein VHW68_09375 [Actinomycetota bacterium]|nr:hypothetical protein [Actinomycetota bacterium]
MRNRLVWPECRTDDTHQQCAGSNATSECICWHHVLQQRHVEQSLDVLPQIEREMAWIRERTCQAYSETAQIERELAWIRERTRNAFSEVAARS